MYLSVILVLLIYYLLAYKQDKSDNDVLGEQGTPRVPTLIENLYSTINKIFMLTLLETSYQSVGFSESTNDDQLTILHRANVLSWACTLGHNDCVSKANAQFKSWLESSNPDIINPISPNLKSVVYCTAIANGGSTEWNFLWERYGNSTLASTRTLILSALGCSKSTTILNNYLKKSVTNNSGIRKQDASYVFSGVYSNTGINTALDFLIDNSQKIKEFYGGMNAVTNSLTGIASRLTTTEQVAKLEKFIAENPDILESAQTGMNAVESAKSNLNWNNDNYDTIVNWLENSNPSNSVSRNKATSIFTCSILIFINIWYRYCN